ncbi:Os03g0448000 [Oryza sativa Japonica Group]|uniref:Os03g0448000 protein n=1 Tax=Oryza sativa subsp. japonica TaxID=39947 RepID=A0A0P0VZ72_ORYSJ|nr:Os03g0448000 [Oryza sativa Japonica Group]
MRWSVRGGQVPLCWVPMEGFSRCLRATELAALAVAVEGREMNSRRIRSSLRLVIQCWRRIACCVTCMCRVIRHQKSPPADADGGSKGTCSATSSRSWRGVRWKHR